jgi:hypothetical protein
VPLSSENRHVLSECHATLTWMTTSPEKMSGYPGCGLQHLTFCQCHPQAPVQASDTQASVSARCAICERTRAKSLGHLRYQPIVISGMSSLGLVSGGSRERPAGAAAGVSGGG